MESFKPENWTISSNECVKISMLNSSTEEITTFQPSFTYPIFGDSEQIFGYKDLELILAFESKTFLPLVNMKYTEKLDDSQLTPESGPLETLLKFLPSLDSGDLFLKDEEKWAQTFTEEVASGRIINIFQKHGELISSTEGLDTFKINIAHIKHLHKRLQVFTLFFIEGASYIDDNDEDWDLYFLIKKDTDEILGYATCYKYVLYESGPKFDEVKDSNYEYRSKISQFIIFPPFQNKGYGSVLYRSIYRYWSKLSNIKEITVEDPNESFDVLRDKNDLLYVVENVDLDEIKQKCQKGSLSQTFPSLDNLKFEQKQLKRLVEMLLLYLGKESISRVQIKKRLYEKNYDALIELDLPDRHDKLQTTYQNVKEDYLKTIQSVKSMQKLQKIHTLEKTSQNKQKKPKH